MFLENVVSVASEEVSGLGVLSHAVSRGGHAVTVPPNAWE